MKVRCNKVERLTKTMDYNNEDDEQKIALKLLSEKYLPFLEEMKRRTKGTAIESKWLILHESIVRPRRR